MSSRELKVGETVHFPHTETAAAAPEYRIVRLLELEDGNRLYAIRSAAEPFDRVVAESDLSSRT